MKATETELSIINRLKSCRYQPGSFDKKFPNQLDVNNISPKQKYWIYKLGFKYRKQIGNDALATICENYLSCNSEPLTRREAQKIISKTNHPSLKN